MSVATSTAIGIAGAIGAAGSVASGVIGSHAASKAADTQSAAAEYAADKQAESAKESLDFQKSVYADQKSNAQPYIDAGKVSLADLSKGLAPGGEFTQQYDASKILADDPGYQFRMDQGVQAIDRGAAANGTLGAGGTLKELTRYGQDYASGEYSNAYNRFEQNQANRFNRLASVAGVGQTATQQVGSEGTAAAGNVANINTANAAQIGQDEMGAANARASGYVGGANAWSSALTGLGKTGLDYVTLSQLFGNSGASPTINLAQLKSLGIAQ